MRGFVPTWCLFEVCRLNRYRYARPIAGAIGGLRWAVLADAYFRLALFRLQDLWCEPAGADLHSPKGCQSYVTAETLQYE